MITYDVDSGGTGDYSEINDSFTGIPASLADHYTISYRASTGIAFSQACLLTARTMNGFKIYIQAAAGHEALISGWDESRARLQLDPGASGSCFVNECNDVEIDGLQISNTRIGDAGSYCYRFQGSATNILVTNTRMSIPDGAPDGYLQETSGSVMFQNFICECLGTQGGGSEGMYLAAAGTLILAGGVIKNFNDAVEQDAGTITCIDLAVFNNGTDFDLAGTNTVDYCISDDGTGTNAQTISAGGLSEFVDPSPTPGTPTPGYERAGDYTAIEGSNLQFGVGTTNPNVLATDMEGDARGVATAYIGVDEPSAGPSPTDFTGGVLQTQLISGAITIGTPATTFSYAQITAGFSGYFDLLTDVNERRFNSNAIWTGTITGTGATLKCNESSTPYIVIVDGVDSNPTIAGGEITLFTGLADVEHDVQFFARVAFQGAGNGLNVNESEILSVVGASPAILNLPTDFITDPLFPGISTNSVVAEPGGNYTPTYDQATPYDRERGAVIFNAQIDEIWSYTDDNGLWLSIDNGTPVLHQFSEPREFAGQPERRLVNVAIGLDNSQVHQYTLWYEDRVTYGTQGIMLKNNGIAGSFSAIDPKTTTGQYGDSITDGSTGATEGEADTYLSGIALDLAVVKAGKNGRTTAQLTADLSNIIAASGMPMWPILAIGRNDYSDVAGFEGNYDTCIDEFFNQGASRLICRGILPNDAADARIITMNNQIKALVLARPEEVYYVDPTLYVPIETIDGTHQTALGYEQTTAFVAPDLNVIIFGTAFIGGVLQTQEISGVLTIPGSPIEFTGGVIQSQEISGALTILSPTEFTGGVIQLQEIFGELTIVGSATGIVKMTYGSVLKPYITGESR